MDRSSFFLNTILAITLFAVLLVMAVIRVFLPAAIFPQPDIPNMVLLVLPALLLDHYLAPEAPRRYGWIALLGGISFGLLPWMAAFADLGQALRLAVVGAAVCTAVTWLFTSLRPRFYAKSAPLVCAVGLYLASQGFLGIF